MQFYLNFDPDTDPMLVLALIAGFFEGLGFSAEETCFHGENGLFICQKLCIDTDTDPEDAESRKEFANCLNRDYGIRTGTELDGQLYPLCSNQEFCDMIRHLLANIKGDVYIFSEWYDMILVRCGEKLTIHEEWQQYFT